MSAPPSHVTTTILGADLTDSDDNDILLATNLGLFWIEYPGNGTGLSEHRTISEEGIKAACVGDFDLDGRLDIVALFEVPDLNSSSQRVGFFVNTAPMASTPSFELVRTLVLEAETADILLCSDVDFDSDTDIVVKSTSNMPGVFLHENVGIPGIEFEELEGVQFSHSNVLLSADLDNSGSTDLVTTAFRPNSSVEFVAIYDAFTSVPHKQTLISNIASGLTPALMYAQLADFSGDSKLDIVWCQGLFLAWHEQTEFMHFIAHNFPPLEFQCVDIQVVDFDEDGDIDVLTLLNTPQGGRIYIHENMGGGMFVLGSEIGKVNTAGDFDTFSVAQISTGHVDVLAGSRLGSNSVLYSYGASLSREMCAFCELSGTFICCSRQYTAAMLSVLRSVLVFHGMNQTRLTAKESIKCGMSA